MYNEKQSIKSPVKGAMSNAVILGAGVIGLSTAYEFLQAYPGASCTIVAEILPGDTPTPKYASHWAGAAMTGHGIERGAIRGMTDLMLECCLSTGKRCAELADKHPDMPLMRVEETDLFTRAHWEEGKECLQSARERAPKVEIMPDFGLPQGISLGYRMEGYSFDPPRYLPWLRKHLEARGVKFVRHKVSSIEEAVSFDLRGKADVLFNCTGLGSKELQGVDDASVYTTEGYVVIIKAPWLEGKTTIGRTDDGWQCAISRPGGTVHLGAASVEDMLAVDRTQRVLKKSVDICPRLLHRGLEWQDLEIVEESSGLRPFRSGGLRIEREIKELKDGSKVMLIHNYAHGGSGYEMSFGSAQKAVNLTQTCF